MNRSRIGTIAVALFLAASPWAAAQTSDISGSWEITINTPQGPRSTRVSFKQVGDKLEGALRGPSGELPVEGTVSGNLVKFSFKVTIEGNEMLISMSGSVDGGSMKGAVDFGGMAQGDWTAKRAEGAAAPPGGVPPAASGPPGGIDGNWDVVIYSPEGTHNVGATFNREAEKLRATLRSPQGELSCEGTMKDNDLRFSFTIKYQGSDMVITMIGKLEGDAIKGSADFGGMAQGDWTAKRASAATSAPAGGPGQQEKVDVSGTWAFTVETAMGTGSPTFTFKQEGENLTGQYKGMLGEAPIAGTVKGNVISFSFKVSAQGMEGTLTYNGTVDKNTIQGTVKLGDLGEGKFTAKKQ